MKSPDLAPCRSCNALLSPKSKSCPRCGEPEPISPEEYEDYRRNQKKIQDHREKNRRKAVRSLTVLGIIFAVFIVCGGAVTQCCSSIPGFAGASLGNTLDKLEAAKHHKLLKQNFLSDSITFTLDPARISQNQEDGNYVIPLGDTGESANQIMHGDRLEVVVVNGKLSKIDLVRQCQDRKPDCTYWWDRLSSGAWYYGPFNTIEREEAVGCSATTKSWLRLVGKVELSRWDCGPDDDSVHFDVR